VECLHLLDGVLVYRSPALRAFGLEQRGNAACLLELPGHRVQPAEQRGVPQFVLVTLEMAIFRNAWRVANLERDKYDLRNAALLGRLNTMTRQLEQSRSIATLLEAECSE